MADDKSPGSVRRDYRGTKGAVDDATGGGKKGKPSKRHYAAGPGRPRGVTHVDSKKHGKGEHGEKTYGAPLSTPKPKKK